jgi:GAF domain-containing protein
MPNWSPSDSGGAPGGIWRPERVEVPRRRAPGDAHLVRLRLRDRPGSLAAVSSLLATHGVDVLRLEVLGREGGFAVDDLLVAGAGLAGALAELGPDVSVLAQRPGIDLLDPGLAMAEACRSLTAAGSQHETYRQLLAAALGLVFAEAGFVCVREGYGVLRPMASTVEGLPALDDQQASLLCSALWSGDCLTADGRVPWVPASYRELLPGGTVCVVPGGSEPFLVLALIRDDTAPFVTTELDRLAALVAVAVGTLSHHPLSESQLAERAPARSLPSLRR